MTQTAGFYKKNGDSYHFAPTAVWLPGGTILQAKEHEAHTYPVDGWTYYSSFDDAKSAEGFSESAQSSSSTTKRDKRAEKTEWEHQRIERIRQSDPQKADKLQARLDLRMRRASN